MSAAAVLSAREGFSNEQGYMARIPVATIMSEASCPTPQCRSSSSSMSSIIIPERSARRRRINLGDLKFRFFARSWMRKYDNSTSNDNAISVGIGISFRISSHIILDEYMKIKNLRRFHAGGIFQKKRIINLIYDFFSLMESNPLP